MRVKFGIAWIAPAVIWFASVSVFAHHGVSEYDTSKVTTVVGGTVTRFDFATPRTMIYWEVKDDQGQRPKMECRRHYAQHSV
jgi:hypothetical protein